MRARDWLKELTIYDDGTYSADGNYVLEIVDSKEYGTVFSKLEKKLNPRDDYTQITETNSSLQYEGEDGTIFTLLADFDEDNYRLVVEEVE